MSDDSPHKRDVEKYIADVRSGRRVTGRLERLAVERHCDDLEKAGERGYYFDESAALDAIEFAGICRHYEGEWAGQPLYLRPEQKFIVWCLMGWRQSVDGMRRFRHLQIEMARKGGKSTFVAYLCCLLLFFDSPPEPAAQGYVAATKLSQAEIVWKAAMRMIMQSPSLRGDVERILNSKSEMAIRLKDGSFLKPLSADKTPDGFNPHFVVKDEEHAWREHHRGQADTLGSGFGARRQPLTVTITTYGSDDSVIWLESHDYAVRCLESVITGEIVNDAWLVMIFAVDYPVEQPCFRCHGESCTWCGGSGVIPVDDPYDENVWVKANPGLADEVGGTPKLARLREQSVEAKGRKEKQSEFFQKVLNIIVAASTERVIPALTWTKLAGELSDRRRATGYGGIDIGLVDDTSAAAIVWPFDEVDDDGKDFTRYEAETKIWIAADRSEATQTQQFAEWVRQGKIIEHSGDAVDLMSIKDDIVQWSSGYNVETWAADRNYAKLMLQLLAEDHGYHVFGFIQNHQNYHEPVTEFLKLMNSYRFVKGVRVPLFRHNGCPVLAWMAGNLATHEGQREMLMPKKTANKNKIDAMVALLMAFSQCLYFNTKFGRSDYQFGMLSDKPRTPTVSP